MAELDELMGRFCGGSGLAGWQCMQLWSLVVYTGDGCTSLQAGTSVYHTRVLTGLSWAAFWRTTPHRLVDVFSITSRFDI